MSKKILILSSTPRKNGNSEMLAEAFAKGAAENGNQVEMVYLRDKSYSFCKGCMACLKTGGCVIKDDAAGIVSAMHDADVIAFATPVYYYSVSGQLKTMLDRSNPLYGSDYTFTDVYLLAAAAEEEAETVEGTEKAIQGWTDCFERAELKDVIFAGGVTDAGDVKGHGALTAAYEAGKKIQ